MAMATPNRPQMKRGILPADFKRSVAQHLAHLGLPVDVERMKTHLECTKRTLAFRVCTSTKNLDKRHSRNIKTVTAVTPQGLPPCVTKQGTSPQAMQRATSGEHGRRGQQQARKLVIREYHEFQNIFFDREGLASKYRSNRGGRLVDQDTGLELSTDEFCRVIDSTTLAWRVTLDELKEWSSREATLGRLIVRMKLQTVNNVAIDITARRLMGMDMDENDLSTRRGRTVYEEHEKVITAFGAYCTMLDKILHDQYSTCGGAVFYEQNDILRNFRFL